MLAGGPALFIAIGFLGFAMADSFLAFPPTLSKPLILAIEAALALSIAGTLALLVAGPPDAPPPDTPPPDTPPSDAPSLGTRPG
jgi:hypothetical protein